VAVSIRPHAAAARNELGIALQNQKKLDEAVTAYNNAIELDPKYANPYTNLGNVLFIQGKLDEAIAAHRKAIELDPKSDSAYVNLAGMLVLQEKPDEAAAAYRKAIELDPKDGSPYGHIGHPHRFSPQVAAYMSLGDLLREQGKLEEAAGVWRELIQRDPRFSDGYLGLGFILLEQEKPEEAIATFKKTFVMDPQYADGQNNVARQLATHSDTPLRDPSFALSLAKKAVELDPKNGAYLNTLGVAYYRMGDWKGAIASLEKSRELREGGKSSEWFFSAMAHWQLGEKDTARESYDRAIQWMEKNAPDNRELIRFRAEAAELLGVAQPQAPSDPPLKKE
jgi:superkiller protein 3